MADKKPRKKRNRATALVLKQGRLLLVRERGAKHWSLPGGGMKKGEDPVTAAIRELDEETKLVATSATYLFHYESPSQHHHVCCLEAEGEVELLKEEIGDYRWWDGETQLSIIESAREIIGRVMVEGRLNLLLSSMCSLGEPREFAGIRRRYNYSSKRYAELSPWLWGRDETETYNSARC